MFSPAWRRRAIAMLNQPLDVLVVGGGITGSGVLLDCAQRGLRALLVEKADLASGTSSRSSKLIHGGLRYLKQMHLGITRTASRERDRLLTLDPHLVRPIRFLYPIHRHDRTPGWQVDLGLWMYDHLTARPDKHAHLDLREVEALAPGLDLRNVDRTLAFADGVTDDARLTCAVAATACSYGAGVLTRCEAIERHPVADEEGRSLVLRDLEDGAIHVARAHVVVMATGVWTDDLRARLGLDGRRLRPSRGIHLVLDPGAAPLSAAVTIPSPDDARPVFIVPHPEGVLLGTTDVFHDGDLDDPRPSSGEVDYLLRAAAAAYPARPPTRGDIRGAFAGLRPILVNAADVPSEASRDEEIWSEDDILWVAGGKLTTWRSTAEEVTDAVVRRLPSDHRCRAAACFTTGTPMVGLAPLDLAAQLAGAAGLTSEAAAGMARRLGSLAWTAVTMAHGPADLSPLPGSNDLTAAEVRAHLRFGAVLHLDDLLLRRVRVGLWWPARIGELLPTLRPLFAQEQGWDGARWDEEEANLHAGLEGWTLGGVRG